MSIKSEEQELHVSAINIDAVVDICAKCHGELPEIQYVAACSCIYCSACITNLRITNPENFSEPSMFVCWRHFGLPRRLRKLYVSMCSLCYDESCSAGIRVYTSCGHVYCRSEWLRWVHHEEQGARPLLCPLCREADVSYRLYLPDKGPPETREVFRPRSREVPKKKNKGRTSHGIQCRSKGVHARKKRLSTKKPPPGWTRESLLNTLSSVWEHVQIQCARILEDDTAISQSAYTSYRRFSELVAAESLVQLDNGGNISEKSGMRLNQAWKIVEQENGGFARDKKGHLRLRVLLTQLEQTQSYLVDAE